MQRRMKIKIGVNRVFVIEMSRTEVAILKVALINKLNLNWKDTCVETIRGFA